ncbi:MAG: hypothetical protein E6I42_05010 [Chloroflexi bacterium]|nr:MAG: hypothetical protein E6J30_10005 [Chloroflexota bacterium]TMF05035.1 MAG: hypothetical protein E6I42_05010 [Chloroflexota bacterium]
MKPRRSPGSRRPTPELCRRPCRSRSPTWSCLRRLQRSPSAPRRHRPPRQRRARRCPRCLPAWTAAL